MAVATLHTLNACVQWCRVGPGQTESTFTCCLFGFEGVVSYLFSIQYEVVISHSCCDVQIYYMQWRYYDVSVH